MKFPIDWLYQALPPPPRKIKLKHSGGLLSVLLRGISSGYDHTKAAQLLLNRGTPVWGSLLKANNAIFAKSNKPASALGVVLVASKSSFADAWNYLPGINQTISLARGLNYRNWDESTQKFMNWFDDDNGKSPHWRRVPAQLSPDVECHAITCLFRRCDLPGGTISGSMLLEMV